MGAISSTTEPDADKIIHANFTLSRDLWDWAAEHGKRLISREDVAHSARFVGVRCVNPLTDSR